MALSRTVPWLLTAAFAAIPASAQIPRDYRLPPAPHRALGIDASECPRSEGDEIVVCGSRDDERYRVPPSQRVAGAASRAGGEQLEALAANPGACSTVGPHVRCAGGLDVLGIAFTIVRAIARARANRD